MSATTLATTTATPRTLAAQRIAITAGIGFDAYGKPLDVTDFVLPALARIRLHLARRFGGYTETASEGGWVNAGGQLVQEMGRTWSVVTDDATTEDAELAAEWVRDELGQSSVLLTTEPLRSAFI